MCSFLKKPLVFRLSVVAILFVMASNSFADESVDFINMFKVGKVQNNNFADKNKLDAKRAALRSQLKKDSASYKVNKSIRRNQELNSQGLDLAEQSKQKELLYKDKKENTSVDVKVVEAVVSTKSDAHDAATEISKWFSNNTTNHKKDNSDEKISEKNESNEESKSSEDNKTAELTADDLLGD